MQLEPDFFTLSAAFDALDDSLLQSIQHATAAEDRRSFAGDKDPSDVEGRVQVPADELFASWVEQQTSKRPPQIGANGDELEN